MSMPRTQELLRPVLATLSDGGRHEVEEIRERAKVSFEITPDELAMKNKAGSFVYVNHVAWALAHLRMEKGPLGHPPAIARIRVGVYRINERGTALLNSRPQELTIEDLRAQALT